MAKRLLLALVVFFALWVIADMILKRSNAPSAPESRRSAPAAALSA